MNKRIRWATGDKVKIIDNASSHFGKTGILIEPKRVPVYGKLQYHWFVKIEGTETIELFAPEQLEKID